MQAGHHPKSKPHPISPHARRKYATFAPNTPPFNRHKVQLCTPFVSSIPNRNYVCRTPYVSSSQTAIMSAVRLVIPSHERKPSNSTQSITAIAKYHAIKPSFSSQTYIKPLNARTFLNSVASFTLHQLNLYPLT